MRRRDFFKTTGAALSSAALATAMPKISAASNTSTSTTPRDSLLMLAWDSVGHPHARRMMHDKRLPNLTSFLHEPGAHLTPLAPTGASLTIPVWTEIFTGLTARQTGAFGNHTMVGRPMEWTEHYDQQHGQFARVGWFSGIPYEHTLQWAMQQHGFSTAWLTSKRGYLGVEDAQSPLARIGQNAQLCVTVKPRSIDDPYMESLAKAAVNFSHRNRKSIIFCHLNPDKFGHAFGGESPEYEHEIERCDETLGRVLSGIDRERTHVMVISDHGFDGAEFRHLNAPWSWCATDIPLRQRWADGGACTVDVYPTVLEWFDVPARKELPQLRGRSLL